MYSEVFWRAHMAKAVQTIFKTHLDVGFTDLATNVIDCYI